LRDLSVDGRIFLMRFIRNIMFGRRLDSSGAGEILVAGYYVHGNKFFGSVIGREFVEQLGDY
jgi:hypothetical protein